MPLPNVFWPDNVYLLHRSAVDLEDPYLNAIKERALHGPPVEFYPREAVREGPPAGAALHALEERVLWLTDSAPAPAPVRAYFESVPPRLPLRSGGVVPDVRWREWSYNDFELDVTAGADGYLVVRQIADPHWRISVDGRPVSPVRADFAAMAFPIASGRHTIRMDYRPLARRLFWPAGLVLTGTFIAMLGGAFVARRREA
jgi:hypothetical protein